MGYVAGRKITDIGPLARLETDGEEIAGQVFCAYLQQILVDGFFHADPHPGNVFLTAERDLALIDLGMVGRLSPAMRGQLLKLVLGVSEGRGDEVAQVAEAISEKSDDFDAAALRRVIVGLVAEQQGAQVKDLAVGRILLEVVRGAMDTGARLPSELANNELSIAVDAIDETLLLGGLQKIANRITLGLVLAALIIGAALLMQVPTSFRIAGYPGFAILCFQSAASGGFVLAWSIVMQDRRERRPRR